MVTIVTINDSSFEQVVLQSDLPVLVAFGAEWCGPCRQIEPVLEGLVEEWNGNVRLARVDVDQNIRIAQQFQVMSLPTVILFINGEARQRVSGKPPRERLVEKFTPFVLQGRA